MLKDIKNFICFNQKQLLRYEFEIAELHKKFKQEKREETLDELIIYGFRKMLNIFENNSKLIFNLFKIEDLRITIKIISENQAIDIFRSNSEPLFKETDIFENSGFSSLIKEKKDYYVNENLEESFFNGEYKNPRLKSDCLEKLKNKEINWKDCWEYNKNKDYYCSTLIIPMAINDENLNKRSSFYKKFFSKTMIYEAKEKTRAVFGFFCLDSKEKYAFSNFVGLKESINIAFICADILSLYLAFYYNHTTASETVNEFLKGKLNETKE